MAQTFRAPLRGFLRTSGGRGVGNTTSAAALEKAVVEALIQRDWQVVRNFWVFDPEVRAHAECGVVAASGQGLVIADIKCWPGDWQASDHTPYRRWKQVNSDENRKSPVWQAGHARNLLLRLVQRDFMAHPVDLQAATKTFVVLEPGRVINASELDQARVWQEERVEVCDVSGFVARMPGRPASPVPSGVWLNLVAYAEHFRITPELRKAEPEVRLRKLEALQVRWETRMTAVPGAGKTGRVR